MYNVPKSDACNGTIILPWYESKKDGKDLESIQSSTTPGPGYDKITIRHQKQEPRDQSFPSR